MVGYEVGAAGLGWEGELFLGPGHFRFLLGLRAAGWWAAVAGWEERELRSEVGSQELGNEVAVANEYGFFLYIAGSEPGTYISSRGEMKISLRLIICGGKVSIQPARHGGPKSGAG